MLLLWRQEIDYQKHVYDLVAFSLVGIVTKEFENDSTLGAA